MVLLAVWKFNLLWAIFFCVVWVLFTTLCTSLSSSASFPLVVMFLTWNILFNPLEAIPDFHFLKNTGLIKYQDICIGLDLPPAFSNSNSSDVCHFLFSQGYCHLFHCSQGQLPTSNNSFWCLQFVVEIFFVCFQPVSRCLPQRASFHSFLHFWR